MDKNKSYLKIPLPLIRELLVSPKSARDIIRYAVYWQANKPLSEKERLNAVRQALYEFCLHFYIDCDYNGEWDITERDGCKKPCTIPPSIIREIQSNIESDSVFDDVSHTLFAKDYGETKQIDDEAVFKLLSAIYKETIDDICLWYKIRQFCQNTEAGNFQMEFVELDSFKQAWAKYQTVNNEVWGYVPFDMMEKYAIKAEKGIVPEYERVQLACFIGLKSIMGAQPYAKTYKEQILARMIGCRGKNDFEGEMNTKNKKTEARRIVEKYSQRRFKDLLNSLLQYGFLRCCFSRKGRKNGGWYFSTSMSEHEVMKDVLQKESEKDFANSRVQVASRVFQNQLQKMKKAPKNRGSKVL